MAWTQVQGTIARSILKPVARDVSFGAYIINAQGVIVLRDDVDFPKFRGYKIKKSSETYYTRNFETALEVANK